MNFLSRWNSGPSCPFHRQELAHFLGVFATVLYDIAETQYPKGRVRERFLTELHGFKRTLTSWAEGNLRNTAELGPQLSRLLRAAENVAPNGLADVAINGCAKALEHGKPNGRRKG